MVDPKKVELSLFSTIERHFLASLPNADEAILTDTKKVVDVLARAIGIHLIIATPTPIG